LIVSACSSYKGAPADRQTQSYVDNAAINDTFEIMSGELALGRALSPVVKRYALMMTVDHARTRQNLKDAIQVSETGIVIPTDLDAKHAKLLQSLQSASGDDFDRLYSRMQQDARAEALAVHRNYIQEGRVPALKVVATEAIPILERHPLEAQLLAGL
jgi:putative membrane protein